MKSFVAAFWLSCPPAPQVFEAKATDEVRDRGDGRRGKGDVMCHVMWAAKTVQWR